MMKPPNAKPPDVNVPDAAGYIIGWRTWNVSQDGLLLSLTDFIEWPVRQPFRARCLSYLSSDPFLLHPDEGAPQERCTCGIYAHRWPPLFKSAWCYTPRVFGRVALWGNVLQHEDAYRAEFAYPLELFAPVDIPRLADYGVPVHATGGIT